MNPPEHVLAPVDLESVAWAALDYAGWLASQSGAIVDIFYALPGPGRPPPLVEKERLEHLLLLLATLTERFSGGQGPTPNGAREPIFVGNMQPGDPGQLILEFAMRGEHDVIVMGSHSRPRLSQRVHTPVAETVVRYARSPVLVVPDRPKGELHPVPAPI